MNKITIPKSAIKPQGQIIGNTVIINLGTYKNGNEKVKQAKIISVTADGIYCDNDEFYSLNMF